jgi:hypothetical protein
MGRGPWWRWGLCLSDDWTNLASKEKIGNPFSEEQTLFEIDPWRSSSEDSTCPSGQTLAALALSRRLLAFVE